MCCRMPRRDMEQTLNMNTKNPYSILGRMINSFFHMILWCPHEFPGHSPRFETNWPQTHGREGRLLSVVGGKYMQKTYQRKAHDTNMYTAKHCTHNSLGTYLKITDPSKTGTYIIIYIKIYACTFLPNSSIFEKSGHTLKLLIWQKKSSEIAPLICPRMNSLLPGPFCLLKLKKSGQNGGSLPISGQKYKHTYCN